MQEKSLQELCEMTGFSEDRMKNNLESAMKSGFVKKLENGKYAMSLSGMYVGSNASPFRKPDFDASSWKCTKCDTINNLLNGNKCMKCGYSFEENMGSKIFELEKMNFKYPKVSDREVIIFIIGHLTGMGMSFPKAPGMSRDGTLQMEGILASVLSDMVSTLCKKFPEVPRDEVTECMIQLNGMRTIPIIMELLASIKRI